MKINNVVLGTIYISLTLLAAFGITTTISKCVQDNEASELQNKRCDEVCAPYQRLQCIPMSVETKVICHDPTYGAKEIWIPTVK